MFQVAAILLAATVASKFIDNIMGVPVFFWVLSVGLVVMGYAEIRKG